MGGPGRVRGVGWLDGIEVYGCVEVWGVGGECKVKRGLFWGGGGLVWGFRGSF